MNVNQLSQRLALLALTSVGSAMALDSQHSIELSLSTTAQGNESVQGLPESLQPDGYQLLGQVDLAWNMTAYLSDRLDLNMRYRLAAQSPLDDAGSATESDLRYRLDDLPANLTVAYSQSLDLLNLTYFGTLGSYSLGRQPISFGQARVFSPVDILLPTSPAAANQSYRSGVDAVRGTWSLGAVSELDAGYVLGNQEIGFARLKGFWFGADWELIALNLDSDYWLYSIGTNTGIGTVGLWQESAVLDAGDETYLRMTLGIDTTLFDDLYVMNELHYNGVGQAEQYAINAQNSFYALGAVVPQAQWYDSLQFSYPLNVLTSLQIGATVNLNDLSTLLNASLSYNAADDLTLQAVSTVPVVPARSTDYEYALYPYVLSLRADWFF